MRLIGDVHGKFKQYREIIRDCPASIQVGDMGIGFRRTQGPRMGEEYSNPPHAAMVEGNHRFIRGNHDNPEACARHSQWIPDGFIENGVMFIGGAVSVDRDLRQEGYNWWPDEELSTEQLNGLTDVYLKHKPRVMITHDGPEEMAVIMAGLSGRSVKLQPWFASRSRQAFQSMWSAHSPELWVFGHWHVPLDQTARGTRFVCLAELEHKDFDI